MIYKTIKVFNFFVLTFLLIACYNEGPDFPMREAQGYRPIYATAADTTITFVKSQPLRKPGKIYSYGKYLMVNEQGKGIHVFDNENTTSPKAVGFLKINGNVDMAIRNNILYVDHLGSLVSLDISDLNNIRTLTIIKTWTEALPPERNHYFECVNPKKGKVIGWESATLKNPKCYY